MMRSEVVKITPEIAKNMLERNMKNNRRVSHDVVQRYARIMRGGGWSLTHQGIAFDDKGKLIDGQHRLNAIVQANVPVKMLVTYDVEHAEGEAFTIDAGRRRTIQNIMQISGINDVVFKSVATYVSSYMRWKMPAGRKTEAAEIIAYIERHYSDCELLYMLTRQDTSNGKRRIPALVGAALLCAIYRGENQDALIRFCEIYRRNDLSGCENYNPKHVLNIRDYVRDHRDSIETLGRIESAIYAFANNRSVLKTRDNCYPFNAALDS